MPHSHNIFDVPCDPKTALVQILPVPFDATTSYRPGAARGPQAILAASVQVDLCDADVGAPHQVGIYMEPIPSEIVQRNTLSRGCVQAIRQAKDKGHEAPKNFFDEVNRATAQNNDQVYAWTQGVLNKGQLPVILGGDHSVPLGAIRACAEHHKQIGILHVDAHCDLRKSYEGFKDSHASIMDNVQSQIPEVIKLTQVGIRDFCNEELETIKKSNGRIVTYFDKILRKHRLEGEFFSLCQSIIDTLPSHVYLSFDIDGLDPTLCPHTGTPVPGGLSFDEILALLNQLAISGKTVVGMDLCEVSPPREAKDSELGDNWDANVGARFLYKMIGFALISRKTPNLSLPDLPSL